MPTPDPITDHPPTNDSERFQAARVATVSAGHAIHDTYTAFLAPLLPVFVIDMALSRTKAGLLTVFLQAPSIVQPVIGYLADRVNLRLLVILAPAVTGTVMSLVGVAPHYAILAMLLVVAGASSATMHAVGPVMVGNLSGRNLGRGMGFWMVGGELGRTLGPIIITSAVELASLDSTPWLMVGGLITSIMLYARLRDVPGRPSNSGQELPLRQALRSMAPLLAPLTGIVVARAFMISALTTYLPLYLSEEGANLWLAGISLSVLEAAGVVGALLGGSLSDRLSRRIVMVTAMVLTPALMLIFVSVTGWLRFPLLLGLGLTALSLTPVIMALVQESFPENRALANGIYMAMNFVLRSGVVVVVGALGDGFGMRWAFIASALVPLLSLPLIYLIPERKHATPSN
jgi:FSR family fosmidomycin resistance protein-like MFS transporter